jgi:SP family general alpha glucoside:H+ symporter-like MFS transporter
MCRTENNDLALVSRGMLGGDIAYPTGWNLAGPCGYIWGGTALTCWVIAWFTLPELKGRSYREVDIMFHRKIPARMFKTTVIDLRENE